MNRLPRTLRLLALLSLAASAASAVDFVVTRYDDPGPNGCDVGDCSLREAVISASFNNLDGVDRILLSAGRYELSLAGVGEQIAQTGDLDVFESVEILGAGATMTIVDANGLDRVFDVHAASPNDVLISGLTVTGGSQSTGGAGVRVGGSASTLVLEKVEIRQNALGAGVFASGFAELTVRASTIEGNGGEGVFANQATATLENVTLSGNGGHELAAAAAGEISCRHCTVRDTFDSTSEVDVMEAGSEISFANSVVVGSCTSSDGGALTSFGGNVESPGASCAFDLGTDLEGELLSGLGSLADFGGPTRTMPPGLLSPALGNGLFASCLAVDQRGASRTVNVHAPCDSGAVEDAPSRPATPIFADGFLQGDPEAWSATVP